MNVNALVIIVGAFAHLREAPVVSAASLAPVQEQARALWTDVRYAHFNGWHSTRNGGLMYLLIGQSRSSEVGGSTASNGGGLPRNRHRSS